MIASARHRASRPARALTSAQAFLTSRRRGRPRSACGRCRSRSAAASAASARPSSGRRARRSAPIESNSSRSPVASIPIGRSWSSGAPLRVSLMTGCPRPSPRGRRAATWRPGRPGRGCRAWPVATPSCGRGLCHGDSDGRRGAAQVADRRQQRGARPGDVDLAGDRLGGGEQHAVGDPARRRRRSCPDPAPG